MYEAQRGRFISIARADLASALAGACQGVPIYFDVSLSAIAKDGAESLVTLTDGRQERFDLVVGADGLHSQVRALVFGPEGQFERFLGCYVATVRSRSGGSASRSGRARCATISRCLSTGWAERLLKQNYGDILAGDGFPPRAGTQTEVSSQPRTE